MSITYDPKQRTFKLDTDNTSYMIAITEEGYLGHLYYGQRLQSNAAYYLLRTEEAPYTPSKNEREKLSFLDAFPLEYSSGGIGDFRESCINIRNASGCMASEFFYESHVIKNGKGKLTGLPATFGKPEEVMTLEITCNDPILDIRLILSYSVFAKCDVITRSVKVINKSCEDVKLEKIYSACLDMDNADFEYLTLHGAWGRERHIQRNKIVYGKQLVSSARGESSHQEHPFIALLTPGTNQVQGEVYAMHFVYSGNFIGQVELTQFDSVRMVMGINKEEFCWNLPSGASFQAPEVVLTYSNAGLGKMTRTLHDFYRNHLIRSPYVKQKRPILLNNWEATYYDFDSDKLLEIAKTAKQSGIEMLVMDDGWFAKRSSDQCSLGDWYVNEAKLKGGLNYLVEEVNKIGLAFGIWFEPEMVSPDSDLYRQHPDWAIHIAGRKATQSRQQYVLDLANPEVIDYVYESVAKILRSANISYVKWDMNRLLSDLGSAYLAKDAQQELFHRYVLGVYELQERLLQEFPHLLLENCSSGGARFDLGMLYYSPQIWCSDDTDAIERLLIQEGTALIYPLSTIGAHVSICPNHEVGRTTPLLTRGHVALAGTFGYELDITKLSLAEREVIKQQTTEYHAYSDLIRTGDYYRIASFSENHLYDCYMVVSKDKEEALLTYVQVRGVPNIKSRKLKLQGLDENATYYLAGTNEYYKGEILVKAGFLFKDFWGDAVSRLYYFRKVKDN